MLKAASLAKDKHIEALQQRNEQAIREVRSENKRAMEEQKKAMADMKKEFAKAQKYQLDAMSDMQKVIEQMQSQMIQGAGTTRESYDGLRMVTDEKRLSQPLVRPRHN